MPQRKTYEQLCSSGSCPQEFEKWIMSGSKEELMEVMRKHRDSPHVPAYTLAEMMLDLRFSEDAGQGFESIKTSVEQQEKSISRRLDDHHTIHRCILRWTRIGGVAAIIAAATGILVVYFEAVKRFNDKSGQDAKIGRSPMPLPPQSRPASATSGETTTTNSNYAPELRVTNAPTTNSSPTPAAKP